MNDFFHIFDFDFTLYKTFEKVYIWSPRGTFFINEKPCIRLNSQEFLSYDLAEDEDLNESSFLDFKNINFNKAIAIKPTIFIFNSVKNKMILTARPQRVSNTIRNHLKGDYDIVGLGDGSAKKKLDFIESLGNSNIIVYEDSQKVINLCNHKSINNVYVTALSNKCTLKISTYIKMKLFWQQIPSPVITEIFCSNSFDGVVLDLEHGHLQ